MKSRMNLTLSFCESSITPKPLITPIKSPKEETDSLNVPISKVFTASSLDLISEEVMKSTNLITAPIPLPLISKLNPETEGSLAISATDLKKLEMTLESSVIEFNVSTRVLILPNSFMNLSTFKSSTSMSISFSSPNEFTYSTILLFLKSKPIMRGFLEISLNSSRNLNTLLFLKSKFVSFNSPNELTYSTIFLESKSKPLIRGLEYISPNTFNKL